MSLSCMYKELLYTTVLELLALKFSDDLHLNEIECMRLLISANQEWGLLGRDPLEILRLAAGLWNTREEI
nr:nuclear pore complex protein NUP205 isoform X3 [Ipomoea trifida]